MNKYIGVKLIHAEPMKHGEYADEKYGVDNPINTTEFSKENRENDGYKVVYEDGYVSWSPKEVFEKAYMPIVETIKDNSISQEDVDKFIKDVNISKVNDRTTVVTVTLVNGFTITKASSSASVENYDQEIGADICLSKIKDDVWMLLGFLLRCGLGGFKD